MEVINEGCNTWMISMEVLNGGCYIETISMEESGREGGHRNSGLVSEDSSIKLHGIWPCHLCNPPVPIHNGCGGFKSPFPHFTL